MSAFLDLGSRVHFVDHGGSGPRTLVLVHGLGGSLLNWSLVGAALGRHGRVFALDLPGFGLSEPPPRGASIDTLQRTLDRFLARVGQGNPVVLMGNSMGGLLSLLQSERNRSSVRAMVLVGPALPRPLSTPLDRQVARVFFGGAIPGLGEWSLRRLRDRTTPEQDVRDMLRLCTYDMSRIPPAVIAAHVALAKQRRENPWTQAAFLSSMRSMLGQLFWERRAVERAIATSQVPTLLIQGTHDRLVPPEVSFHARGLNPTWKVELIERSGHIPQLENPELFLSLVEGWLSALSLLLFDGHARGERLVGPQERADLAGGLLGIDRVGHIENEPPLDAYIAPDDHGCGRTCLHGRSDVGQGGRDIWPCHASRIAHRCASSHGPRGGGVLLGDREREGAVRELSRTTQWQQGERGVLSIPIERVDREAAGSSRSEALEHSVDVDDGGIPLHPGLDGLSIHG